MHRRAPRRSAPALLVAAVMVAAVLGVGATLLAAAARDRADQAPRLVVDRALVAPRPEVRAAQLLRRWDQSRAGAWADADRAALADLYVAGSAAGRRDDAMLAAWTRRGVRVQGLRTQVVRVQVLAHRPGRFELEVVDRVVAGTATGPGVARALPRDAPSTRQVVLLEQDGRWLVDRVTAHHPSGPGAAPEVSAAPTSAPP